MIKIESVIAKLFLILSAIFAVIMIRNSFASSEQDYNEVFQNVGGSVPEKKYYIPALRRRY